MKGLREKPPGSGKYEYAIYDPKKKPTRKYVRFQADDEDEAIEKALGYKRDYAIGEWSPWNDARKNTIEEAVEAYMAAHAHQRKNTLVGKQSSLNAFLRMLRSERKLSDIDESHIARYRALWRNKGTVRGRLNVLKHFWQWCVDEGYARRNPVQKYLRRNRGILTKPKTGRDAMMPDEFIQIHGEATTRFPDSYLPAFIELGICTGLRRGELIDINAQDTKLDGPYRGSVSIREWTNPATGRHFVPKTDESTRIVPLVPRAAALLRQILGGITTDDPWQHLFVSPPETSRRTHDHVRENDASGKFRECRIACGLPDSITLHSTRHSYLSWLIILGVDPYALKSIAGHSSLHTQEVYIHFAHSMLSGGASEVRRQVMRYLCPGVSEDVLAFAFPDSASWYGSAASAPSMPILDMLFGATLYDEELVARVKHEQMRRGAMRN